MKSGRLGCVGVPGFDLKRKVTEFKRTIFESYVESVRCDCCRIVYLHESLYDLLQMNAIDETNAIRFQIKCSSLASDYNKFVL